MMKHEKHLKTVLSGPIVCLLIFVSISGCTSNQTTKGTSTELSGTWVGAVNMPMSGGRGNTSISQITFTSNTAEITLTSTRGSFTMNYTYTMNGTTLVLAPTFTGRSEFPRQPLQNGSYPWNDSSRPPMNATWPVNGTRPYNGTRPGNWTRPENGSWNPGGGQRSMSVSFTYSFSEDHTLLYLNGAELRKVQ